MKAQNRFSKTVEQTKKFIFNFITLNALMFVISILLTGCAKSPVIDNNTEVQNKTNQPSISLARTAEASETTEELRTPTAEGQIQNMSPAPSSAKPIETSTTPGIPPEHIPPVGSIQTTEKKPTVKERLVGQLKTSIPSIKGTSVLEETAAGTYIHLQAEGLDPKSSYNLSLYDKTDCQIAQRGRAPTSRPQKVLAKLPITTKGNIKFSQFFEGLKIKGESGITTNSIIITENTQPSASGVNQKTRASAACVVLNN